MKFNPNNLSLRPITDADLPFLNRLYHSTRVEEVAVLPWSDADKAAFLDMQFQAQHAHYQAYYPKCAFDVIELKGKAIGRLYLDKRQDEFRIVDIALLPEYRGCGIGSHFMKKILADAAAHHLPVRIHVEHNNPAMHLYLRLGFQHIETNGVYHLMEWIPNA